MGGYIIHNSARELSGWVYRNKLPEYSFDISDRNGIRIYQIGRNKDGIFLKEKMGRNCLCHIYYPSDTEGNIIQHAYTRPPMAEKMSLSVRIGVLEICQLQNRSFTVWLDRKKIGEMRHMQSLVREVILSDRIPPEYCGLCFAAGFLMLHDDDIEIV